jgi:hypothetical protein
MKKLQYIVIAWKPSGEHVFQTATGFTHDPDKAFVWRSIEMAALAGKQLHAEHPDWRVDLRVSEAK